MCPVTILNVLHVWLRPATEYGSLYLFVFTWQSLSIVWVFYEFINAQHDIRNYANQVKSATKLVLFDVPPDHFIILRNI